ncbi:hypothetical protein EPN18_00575 [bacterium]|nr:MAG: hypothetical protein EPN18_00575 [bacterium]
MSISDGVTCIHHGEAGLVSSRHEKPMEGLSAKEAGDLKEVRREKAFSKITAAKLPDARISAMLRLKAGNASNEFYGTDIKKVAEKMIERALRDALGRNRSAYSNKKEGNS